MAEVQGETAVARVVLGAHSCEGYVGVTHAIVDLDDSLASQLKTIARVCQEHRLVRVAARGAPAEWLPIGIKDEHRFGNAVMEVSADGMWFEDEPKHADGPVQTRWIALSVLEQLRKEYVGKTVLYENNEVRVLADYLLSNEEAARALNASEEDEDAQEGEGVTA